MGKWYSISSSRLTKAQAHKGVKTRKKLDRERGLKHHYRVHKTKYGYEVQGYE